MKFMGIFTMPVIRPFTPPKAIDTGDKTTEAITPNTLPAVCHFLALRLRI